MTDKESQKVEFKSDWKDDCLKAISAFANCMGGKLFIGLINDISRITATRDLSNLVEKGIFKRVGTGKRQVHYVLNDSKKMQ